ncbi:MAG: ice-binding family protein [Coriobacteriia bacterium]
MKSRIRSISVLLALALVAMLAVPAVGIAAEPTVTLGTTQDFAILAGTTITNTGDSEILGDVGVSPGSALTGFDTVTLDGETHSNDALAIQAQTDWVTAYNDAVSRPVTTTLATPELGGLTLMPGVYSSGGALALTGELFLDGLGDPESVFILKSDSGLTIGAGSVVTLLNGARFCRVFWPVASSATIGANADFVGHILATTSISLEDGASVEGQLLAHTGGVTLINNTISNDWCAAATTTTVAPTNPTTTATPTTVSGGRLPDTATPWYNVLVASIAVLLLGGVGLTLATRKIND